MAIHRGTVVAVRLFDAELKRLDKECVKQRLTRSDVMRLALDYYLSEGRDDWMDRPPFHVTAGIGGGESE